MAMLLTVGRIEDESAEDAAIAVANSVRPLPTSWLGKVKIELVPWLSCPPVVAELDCLNVASIAAFIRHAAELEAIPANMRIGHSRWPHLPDFEQTFWLPFEFEQPRVFNSPEGFPFAVASASRLVEHLEQIRDLSPHGLGAKPATFGVHGEGSLGPEETLRWVWYALHLGASEALSRNAPLALG